MVQRLFFTKNKYILNLLHCSGKYIIICLSLIFIGDYCKMKKIMSVMFFILTIALTPMAYANTQTDSYWRCDALKREYRVSDTQVYNMWRSYEYGKGHNLGWTLAAISFRESSAGINLVNPNDPSGGHHHILARHVINEFGMPNTPEGVNAALEMLASNFYLSAYFAVRELKWWQNRHRGDWFRAVRSYNQGHYWLLPDPKDRVRSWNYATNVQTMVRFMQSNCTNWH